MDDQNPDTASSDLAKEQHLSREIAEAFADVPYPGDDNITTHACAECEFIAKSFRGMRWNEVPLSTLSECHDSLPLLSPEAFRHYLPAYLIAVLLHYPDEVEVSREAVFYSLTPPEDPTSEDWFRRRFEGFTSAQTDALRSYVKFYLAGPELILDDERERAMRFWHLNQERDDE